MFIFFGSLLALAGLFLLAAVEVRAGRRFGGARREQVDAAFGRFFALCRCACTADSRARVRACAARYMSAAVEQFSRVRAPGALLSQRAATMMFAGRRSLIGTPAVSPFLRKMAGYKKTESEG